MHSGRSWNVCCETTWGIVNYSALWWSLKRRITRCQFINICGCCHLFVYLFILGGVSLPQYRYQKLKRENELYTTFSLLVEIWNKRVNPRKCHYFEEKKTSSFVCLNLPVFLFFKTGRSDVMTSLVGVATGGRHRQEATGAPSHPPREHHRDARSPGETLPNASEIIIGKKVLCVPVFIQH